MPRYYFDIDEDGIQFSDDTGIDCETMGVARDNALDALPRMACDLAVGGPHVILINVRDLGGREVFQASLKIDASSS